MFIKVVVLTRIIGMFIFFMNLDTSLFLKSMSISLSFQMGCLNTFERRIDRCYLF